jgi:hypothetical protein
MLVEYVVSDDFPGACNEHAMKNRICMRRKLQTVDCCMKAIGDIIKKALILPHGK